MKKNKNFMLVFIGQIISLFGSAIQRFSISLYLLELTGSAAVYSNLLALSVLPYIFFAPIAGKISDSFSRKKIMIVLDVLAGILLCIYSLFFLARIDSVVLSGAVLILLAALSACYNPAVTASLPQIVEPQHLKFANGCISQVGAWSNILGPVLAGILYGFWDIGAIIIFNACSFLISAVLECLIQMPEHKRDKSERIHLLSSSIHMAKTWKALRRQYAVTAGVILSYGFINICIVPVNTILFPAVVNLQFHVSSQTYGIVEGIITCGMLLGGILVVFRPKWFRFRHIYRFNYPMPVMLVIMGIVLHVTNERTPGITVMALGGMVIMFCLGVGNIVTLTYIQHAVPVQMLGSVSALSTAVATGTVPVGQILFGQMMDSRLASGTILIGSGVVAAFVSWYVRGNIRKEKSSVV